MQHKNLKQSHFTLKPYFIAIGIGVVLIIPIFILTFALESKLVPATEEFQIALPQTFKEELRIQEDGIYLFAFVDFQCQFCKSADPVLTQLSQFYDDSTLSIRTRHFLLDESNSQSIIAAMAYECLNDQGLGTVAKSRLYEHQDSFSLNTILEIGEMSPNYEQFVSCIENPQVYQRITSDTLFARSNELPGTPAYVLVDTRNPQNARLFVGIVPFELIVATMDSWT